MHRATTRFWDSYNRLPEPVKKAARQNFGFFEVEPQASLLALQENRQVLVCGAGLNYRALAVKDGPDLVWVWIGPHDEYEKLV